MNGRITFTQEDDNGFLQVYVANADLRSLAQITSDAASSGFSVWAPGGSRIAFDSDRADSDTHDSTVINDVFTMKPDGSDVVKLTDSKGFSADPAYSPDGFTVAFAADRGNYPAEQGIYLALAADGSSLQRVTTVPATAAQDLAPRFSPDGTKLIFTRYRAVEGPPLDPEVEVSALYVVNVDGSGLKKLVGFDVGARGAGEADWSPDGTRIVFETNAAVDENGNILGAADIYVINADGSGLKKLTRNQVVLGAETFRIEGSSDPVWSPDGTKILFLDERFAGEAGSPLSDIQRDLATMNPDGSARAFVAPLPLGQEQPDWESIP